METYLNEQEAYLKGLHMHVSGLKELLEKNAPPGVKEKDERSVYVYARLSGVRSPKEITQVLCTDLGTTLFDIENALDAVKAARRVLLGQEQDTINKTLE